jgi:hypothetical protein
VLSLADGNVTLLQAEANDDAQSYPSWRGSDEVCFLSSRPTNSAGHEWEVTLWKNGTNRVISADWPAEFRKGFLEK